MTTGPRSAVRRLFVSRVISLTGGAAAFLALNFYIYRRTGSTAWLAAALVLTFGAAGLASPFAGALGDRFDRRRMMIASDLLGAAAFLAMSLVRSPGPLLGLAFLSALAEAPFFSASAAAIPNLVSDDDLAWANGMVAVGRNAGIVLGPISGGLLFSAVGAGAVFAMNGVTFVVSAALVASVHGQFRKNKQEQTARILRAVANPYVTILGHMTGRQLLRHAPAPVPPTVAGLHRRPCRDSCRRALPRIGQPCAAARHPLLC